MGACISVEVGRDTESEAGSAGRGEGRGTGTPLPKAKSEANGGTQPREQALPRAPSASTKRAPSSRQGGNAGGKPGTRAGAGAGAASTTGAGAGVGEGVGTGREGGAQAEAGIPPGGAPGHAPLRRFTLKELSVATGRFKRENEVGEGSFGKVYRGAVEEWLGELASGQKRMVAVKVLDENSFQGFGEWMAEVLLLGRLKHPNLVRLLGYCTEKDEAALVYDFLPNGSLDSWLFQPGTRRALTWEERMRVARGATEGLGYLHAQNVIHRDFKSCNILLDDSLEAKLTDFGMATTGPEGGDTHVSTRVMGTLGYLDPKYMETGHLTPKSDIYALGVVYLELLTGRPPTADPEEGWPPGGEGEGQEEGRVGSTSQGVRLTTWIRPHLNQRRPDLSVIVDSRLQGQYSAIGAHKMLVLAKHCLSEDPAARPHIAEMMRTVRQVADLAASLPEEQPAPSPTEQQSQPQLQPQQAQRQPQQAQRQPQQAERQPQQAQRQPQAQAQQQAQQQMVSPPPQRRAPSALEQQQRQNSLQRGEDGAESQEGGASLDQLGPLMEGRHISKRGSKKGAPEESSFDATRSLFKDVASPR